MGDEGASLVHHLSISTTGRNTSVELFSVASTTIGSQAV